MSDHLSSLQLDEVVAGLAAQPAHLATCADCTRRLESLRAQSAAFLLQPEARRQLESHGARLAPRRNVLPFIALALAAGVAVFFAWPRAMVEDRLKGAPSVVLLDEAGHPVTHAAPGTRLTLAVGAAGFPRVEVFAIDGAGKKESLYSGAVAGGAQVPLTQLEVTPGDVTVTAVFEREAEHRSVSVKLAVP